MGSGTGFLGVCVGLQQPSIKLTLTDLEQASLDICRENLQLNGVEARCAFYQWGRHSFGERFDLVIGSDIIYGAESAPVIVA